MNIKWKKGSGFLRKNFFTISLFLAFLLFLIVSTNSLEKSNNKESIKSLENALNKAVVECYAIEGYYPPNIDYIASNYGISIDDDKYIVHYEIFASNIYPDINIIIKR